MGVRTLQVIFAISSLPLLLAGLQTLFSPSVATELGTPFTGTPLPALHVIGLSSLSLGITELVLATQASHNTKSCAGGFGA
ncbi:hypothetical protein G7046_g4036 [Stylonectria norvegica]|nr:hypothetical protein G7046_g4036 [Stylonectria norvegica]